MFIEESRNFVSYLELPRETKKQKNVENLFKVNNKL